MQGRRVGEAPVVGDDGLQLVMYEQRDGEVQCIERVEDAGIELGRPLEDVGPQPDDRQRVQATARLSQGRGGVATGGPEGLGRQEIGRERSTTGGG